MAVLLFKPWSFCWSWSLFAETDFPIIRDGRDQRRNHPSLQCRQWAQSNPLLSFIEAHSDPTHNPSMSCTVNMSRSGQRWWFSKVTALYHERAKTGSRKWLRFVNCVVQWPWTTTAGTRGMALACRVWWSSALGTVYSLQDTETHRETHNYKNTTGNTGIINCIYIRYSFNNVFLQLGC